MAFQSTVSPYLGFGVVGELALEGPLRSQPARIVSGSAANNVMGRAVTWTSGGTGSPTANGDAVNPANMVVAAGGSGRFMGIIGNPKVYPGTGTTVGGTLASTLAVPNYSMVECVQETAGIIVDLPASSEPGDTVYFLTADGTLVTTAPGAAAPVGANTTPIGTVERFDNAGASLAVISLGRAGPQGPQGEPGV